MAFGLKILLWIGFAGGAEPLNPAPWRLNCSLASIAQGSSAPPNPLSGFARPQPPYRLWLCLVPITSSLGATWNLPATCTREAAAIDVPAHTVKLETFPTAYGQARNVPYSIWSSSKRSLQHKVKARNVPYSTWSSSKRRCSTRSKLETFAAPHRQARNVRCSTRPGRSVPDTRHCCHPREAQPQSVCRQRGAKPTEGVGGAELP
jgi:hypothetical protein